MGFPAKWFSLRVHGSKCPVWSKSNVPIAWIHWVQQDCAKPLWEMQPLSRRNLLNQHKVWAEAGESPQHRPAAQPVAAGGMSALLMINVLSFSLIPVVSLWRRKQLRKRKGKGTCALGSVSRCFWELATAKQPRALRREISSLLEEGTWCLLRKAAVGWAAHTKGPAAQQGKQDYLLTLQNVCNETAKHIPSPPAAHETSGWSCSQGCSAWLRVAGSRGDWGLCFCSRLFSSSGCWSSMAGIKRAVFLGWQIACCRVKGPAAAGGASAEEAPASSTLGALQMLRDVGRRLLSRAVKPSELAEGQNFLAGWVQVLEMVLWPLKY